MKEVSERRRERDDRREKPDSLMLMKRNHIIQRSRRLQLLPKLHRLHVQDVRHHEVPQHPAYHRPKRASMRSQPMSRRDHEQRKEKTSSDSRNNPSQPLPQPIERLRLHPILDSLPLIPLDQRNPTHEVPSSTKLKEEDEDVRSDGHGRRGEEELERGGDLRKETRREPNEGSGRSVSKLARRKRKGECERKKGRRKRRRERDLPGTRPKDLPKPSHSSNSSSIHPSSLVR